MDGRVTMDMTSGGTTLADTHAGHVPPVAALDLAPSVSSGGYGPAGHVPTMVGDVKLFELRHMLLREGIQADLVSGVLVCEGSVVLRRDGEKRIAVEGLMSPTYFKVRELVYTQFQFV